MSEHLGRGKQPQASELTAPPEGTAEYRPGARPATVDAKAAETVGTVQSPPNPAPVTDVDSLAATKVALDGPRAAATTEPGPGGPAGVPGSVAGYEILGVLGRGAMGVVYQARQAGLNRLVALKMILAGGHAGDHEVVRFRAEAEAVARLEHPNIVRIYEVGQDAGRPFLSLEYVDGDSLARKIDGTPQPPRQAAELTLQLARGMAAAHQKGIIHRDLKPANILLTKEGVAKITDFGLAKRLENQSGQTHAGTVLGTPSYMPPEQAEGRIEHTGPPADVYSLGAVLYELLTGRPPFRGASTIETLQMVQTQEPVPPSQFQPGVPRDLETICLKCLQKDSARRYATAADLAEDLRRFLAGEPTLARPVGTLGRAVRWCRRNPRVALLSGAVVLLVIAWAATSSALAYVAWKNAAAAEKNRQAAVTAAEKADREKRKAEKSETKAKVNARRARTKEAEAKKSLQMAISRQEGTTRKMIGLAEALVNKLRSQKVSEQLAPEAKKYQDAFMAVLRDKMLELAREFEKAELSNFSSAAAYQQLGDLLFRLGQRREALKQYEQAYRLIKKVADDDPDNDMARANLGMMSMRRGDVALERDGDARAARAHYQKGWDLQHTISVRPRSGTYSKERNTILLSHHAVRLGRAYLEMGDSAAARKQFQKARKLRRQWAKLQSQSAEARSWLAEAWMWEGIAAARRGDAKALESFRKALKLAGDLVKGHPKYGPYQADLAEVYGALGDAQVCLGKAGDATKSYRQSRKYLGVLRRRNPDDPGLQPALALLEERLGADARRHGRQKEAEGHFQQALKIRADIVLLESANRVWQAAYVLALARCGRWAEAALKANELRKQATTLPAILLPLARCYAVCAAGPPAMKARYEKKALRVLKKLPRLGYRDAAVLRTDPDLATLRKDPAFRSLVDQLAKR
jgi:serine/threonine-protein kinase